MMSRIFPYCLLFVLVFVLAKSQETSPGDSIKAGNALTKKYASLFGKEWSKKFVEAWNNNPETLKVMGGLGKVYFISVDKETSATLVNFDSLGRVSFLSYAKSNPKDTIPKFTTTLVRWAEFMEGKFHAVEGVLTKKIDYKGPMTIAFKYGWHFDKVAPISRRIVEALNSKSPEETSPKKKSEQSKKSKKK